MLKRLTKARTLASGDALAAIYSRARHGSEDYLVVNQPSEQQRVEKLEEQAAERALRRNAKRMAAWTGKRS